MQNKDQVILVDENDVERGTMDKLEAHQKGVLHRAISVLIFNSKGEWLLQQRADQKYHSPGLWTNTCCSHPYLNEPPKLAAERRLKEEMGLNAILTFAFKFIYKADFDNGLTEHELDHVFLGYSDVLPEINTEEVKAYRFLSTEFIENDLQQHPEHYTEWFKIIFPKVIEKL